MASKPVTTGTAKRRSTKPADPQIEEAPFEEEAVEPEAEVEETEDFDDEELEAEEEAEGESEEETPGEGISDDEEEDDEDFLEDDEEDDDEDLEKLAGSGRSDPAAFDAKRKSVELDFSGETGDQPTIPPGDYPARVTDVEFKESSTGKDMLAWRFQITAGKFRNASVGYWTMMDQQSRWKSAQTLKALGCDVENKKFKLDPAKLEHAPCILRIIADPKNQDFPYRISKVLPPDAAAIKAGKLAAKDLV